MTLELCGGSSQANHSSHLRLPQNGEIYTASPHRLSFSDENAVVTVWFLVPAAGHAMEPRRHAVTFNLAIGGVDHLGFGNAAPLRERIYNIQSIECNGRGDVTDHNLAITDDGTDDKSSAKLLKQKRLADWLQNLPHPDGWSAEESHSIELRSQNWSAQESHSIHLRSQYSSAEESQDHLSQEASQLEQSDEFYHFEDLPLEIRRYIIEYFAIEALSCFCPYQPDALWRHLSKIMYGSLHRNLPLEMVTARIGYLRECMELGTSWYQVIGRLLLIFPLVSSTDGMRFLRQVKLNLETYKFGHFGKSNEHVGSAGHNKLNYLHIPEYFEYKDSLVDYTIDSQFSAPFLNDAEQLIIAPVDWGICADGDYPGGPTAFGGWGNAWMIQDAFRAYTKKVKRLALSLGSTG